jgi:hypothetical protein
MIMNSNRADTGPKTLNECTKANGLALFTDLYELTMLQAYYEEGMTAESVFTLSVRRLPARRNFLLACGVDTVLDYLETIRFGEEDLAYLSTLGLSPTLFSPGSGISVSPERWMPSPKALPSLPTSPSSRLWRRCRRRRFWKPLS